MQNDDVKIHIVYEWSYLTYVSIVSNFKDKDFFKRKLFLLKQSILQIPPLIYLPLQQFYLRGKIIAFFFLNNLNIELENEFRKH